MNKRKITTRVILDGVVEHTFTQMRQIYTDDRGEYVKCERSRRYIVNDNFDLVYTTGRVISASELFKEQV